MSRRPMHSLLLLLLAMSVPCWADFFVSPEGADDNPGTEALPFQTLERARDEIRAMKQKGALPEGGIAVTLLPGEYAVGKTFQLTAEDSGVPEAPIVYRAPSPLSASITGGVRLTNLALLEEESLLARLPESARGHVWTADLSEAGITNTVPFARGGYASGRGFQTHPETELFIDGEPMTVAQWPNDGFAQTGEVLGPLTLVGWDKRPGSEEGRFRFESERLAAWAAESNGWLYGYWYWGWADSYERIEKIDLENQEISLAEPWSRHGYRKDQRFQAVNMLCELDAPGEWHLDREGKRLYVYPKAPIADATVELSIASAPFMTLEGASHLRFQGLLWECGAADGIVVKGGQDCRFEGCTLRKMAGNGLEIHGGEGHAVLSCDIHTMGRGGIVMNGGDRKTLAPGGHLVENCRLYCLSRIDRTYTPAVLLGGVGNHLRHNLVYNVASSAFRIGGNDHLIELNEVHSVVLESDDQGAVDMWGNAAYRGIVYRHNYWRHLGNWEGKGHADSAQRAAIRLDDAISGVLIEGNVFHQVCTPPTHFGAVQIHGGKDNVVQGNLFLDCAAAVSFTAWGESRWREFVANTLEDPAIDKERYLQRYPALARLAEDHDAAIVRDNVLVRCEQAFLRPHKAAVSENNQEYPESEAFLTKNGERLTWSQEQAASLGVDHIPFEKIGLYADRWRSQ